MINQYKPEPGVIAPPDLIRFTNAAGETIGRLNMEGDTLRFDGQAEESARLFMEHVVRQHTIEVSALHQRAGRLVAMLETLYDGYLKDSFIGGVQEDCDAVRALLDEEPTYIFQTGAYQVELSKEQWDRVHTVFENYNEYGGPDEQFRIPETDINGLVSEILVALELAKAE
jgi:hypothetical protein